MQNLEVIRLHEVDDKYFATLSYQDMVNGLPINNYYTTKEVPINLRPLQRSVRGNILVDQSVKEESLPIANMPDASTANAYYSK